MRASFHRLLSLLLPLYLTKKPIICIKDKGHDIKIKNKTNKNLKVHWVNTNNENKDEMFEEELAKIEPNQEDGLTSYNGHMFLIQEILDYDEDDGLDCIPGKILYDNDNDEEDTNDEKQPMEIMIFITDEEDQEFIIYNHNDKFELEYNDAKSKILKELDTILNGDCNYNGDEQVTSCFETKVIDKLYNTNYKEIEYEIDMMQKILNDTIDYICDDKAINETISVTKLSNEYIKLEDEEAIWYDDDDDSDHKFKIVFDGFDTKIQLIDNFLSEEQCQSILEYYDNYNDTSKQPTPSFIAIDIEDEDDEDLYDLWSSIIQKMYDFQEDATTEYVVSKDNDDEELILLFNKTNTSKGILQNIHEMNKLSNEKIKCTMIVYCTTNLDYKQLFIHSGVYIVPNSIGMGVSVISKNEDDSNGYKFTDFVECSKSGAFNGVIGLQHSFYLDESIM